MNSGNDILAYINEIAERFGFHSLKDSVHKIAEISTNEFLDFVIVGQFKTGKSSFINALIGKDILPIGVIPITAVITRIYYGAAEKAIIYYNNKTKEEIEISKIDEFIVERKNPKNNKNVSIIDIETPLLHKYPVLRIIDTPGLGSIFEHNTKITKNWFEKIGIAFYALSVERPFSKEEYELLKNILLHTPDVYILITKCDFLKQEQLSEVESYLKQQLTEGFNKDFQILFFSIKDKTAEYLNVIENKIIEPKISYRELENKKIFAHKQNYLIFKTLDYLEIKKAAAHKTESEKQHLNFKIDEEKSNIFLIDKELELFYQINKEKNRSLILEEINKYTHVLIDKIISHFEKKFMQWSGNLYVISRRYEDWTHMTLSEEFTEILNAEYQYIQNLFSESNNHLVFYIRTFKEKLNNKIFELFNINLSKETWQPEVTPLKQPDISIYWAFDNNIDMLWFLFPMFVFKKMFLKYFIRQIKREISKNLHRMANDITENLHKEVMKNKKLTIQYFFNEIDSIKNILAATSGIATSELIDNNIQYLKSWLQVKN